MMPAQIAMNLRVNEEDMKIPESGASQHVSARKLRGTQATRSK
jgi:hypothetical protein